MAGGEGDGGRVGGVMVAGLGSKRLVGLAPFDLAQDGLRRLWGVNRARPRIGVRGDVVFAVFGKFLKMPALWALRALSKARRKEV